MREAKEITLVLASNDKRSRNLEQALRERVGNLITIDYDPVAPHYKYLAALLSYHPDRAVWWTRYQWHPIIQAGRRANIVSRLKSLALPFDALLMWGSWTHPLKGSPFSDKPFYYYIDQSCNKRLDPFDPVDAPGLTKPRLAFNQAQGVSYRDAKRVFCMSQWTREQTLDSHDIEDDKAVAVGWGPIGINLLEEDLSAQRADKIVLFVGNEFLRKGMDYLREAIPMVVDQVPDARFIVVGENADHYELEGHPNLELTGLISDVEALKNLYRTASVFVLPHRFERAGHVIIEAMTAGLPIVTSNQGGPPEVVKEGVNGFVMEIGDVNKLAESLITLLQNPDLVRAFGESSKQIAADGYLWGNIADKMLDCIVGDLH
ncbi:MAG: hypothetical protein CMK83_07335 [Pseudomonadales bacterium]|uniref:glycosyltransferase family 4 protein n=1 Tax=unclassified Ketobacter TaxID=2639109 RepID=UPI000C8B318D|nr:MULTISPECIES: glycosyltransferase family 4 protein [unclassified Ketobacter]MAQ24019.1 hypothetical protein [Pseudomonadales bacterium]MEC8813867.1 glycosyltransferase family 4 protein [Pseudomonadota bacterium]HAG96661.1 hypothetical protein [Gammaproteobacteria bacterium]MCK5792498.1 glycosyltransferase family 4 protein [Ketobacter sp.]RLT87815.1 MAG: glycosyltransferase family 1 protein [Ketobacter sp. GenoA1]|tara:strand:- start:22749 stop:23873 length:1125 start_codon:yes stop_codon:yes gene_type:complete